ncbi:MAG TPA: DUF4175 family protein [Myxococcaceae bacterium]|nr:DUF4175 family protein [Myxococcaceae bacterium]
MIDPSSQPPTFEASPPPAASQAPEQPGLRPRAHHRLLAQVRALQRRQLWLQGILYGAAAFAVLALAAGFAAQLSVSLGRVLMFLAPIAFAGLAAGFGLYLSRKQVGDELRTARLVGSRLPHVSLDLVSALEIERELARKPEFSTELAEAFLSHASGRSKKIDPRQVVPSRPLQLARRVMAGVGLVVVVVLAVWSRPWGRGISAVFTPEAVAAVSAHREPITGDIELTYRYPAYTGLAPRTVPGTSGEITAPAGTEVQLKTHADRDVSRAEVEMNGQRFPLEVSGKRDLSGTLVLDKPGTYAFVFLKATGREVARGPDMPIHVDADQAPQVVIQAPGEELEIDPGQKVSLKFEASDDYGLSQLELVYKLPGKAEEVRLPMRRDEGRRTKGLFTWDLGTIKVSPGDRITYSVEAKDNDAVQGPKKGASRTHVLKVYSAAEHRRAALEKAEALWERLVIQLADRMEGPDRQEPKSPEKVAGHAQVDEAGKQLAGDFTAAAQEIAAERDAPEEIWTALVNIAQSMRPKVLATTEARKAYVRYQRLMPKDVSWGKRLASITAQEIAELEKDVLYLESLLDRQKLLDLQEVAKQLANERRELTSLIEDFQRTKDPKVQEDILRQIEALRGRIDELMQRMGELSKGIRDEHLNSEALQQMMQEKDMGSALDEVEQMVREGNADEALKKMAELSQELEQMMQNLDGAQQEFGEQQFPELAEKFQKFSDELKKTAEEQKRVAQQTKEISDAYRQKMKERLQERARALRDQLMEQAQRVSKDYQTLGNEEFSQQAERPLEEVQAELDNLQNALKVEDFDLALEAAQRAQSAANDLESYAQQQKRMDEVYQRPPEMRKESDKLAQRLEKNSKQVEDIAQKLQNLFPSPGQMMSEADKEKLRKLTQEQRQLEQRAEGLRQQMEEMEQTAPIFGEDAMEQMNQVSERMDGAAQKMDAKDPGRGHSEQKAALDQLAQLQQQMQQQRGKQKKGGMPLPMFAGRKEGWGQNQSQQKVEIPDEDQFQAPKEFRKDLLEAMKQGAPDKYRDQVKRYYEELVK